MAWQKTAADAAIPQAKRSTLTAKDQLALPATMSEGKDAPSVTLDVDPTLEKPAETPVAGRI